MHIRRIPQDSQSLAEPQAIGDVHSRGKGVALANTRSLKLTEAAAAYAPWRAYAPCF